MPVHPLGHEIHAYRTGRQLTFKKLASLANCSAPYLWKVENGTNAPRTVEFLGRLARALSLSETERARLFLAAYESQRVMRIEGKLTVRSYRIAHEFARALSFLKEDDLVQIEEILSHAQLKEKL